MYWDEEFSKANCWEQSVCFLLHGHTTPLCPMWNNVPEEGGISNIKIALRTQGKLRQGPDFEVFRRHEC